MNGDTKIWKHTQHIFPIWQTALPTHPWDLLQEDGARYILSVKWALEWEYSWHKLTTEYLVNFEFIDGYYMTPEGKL